MALLALVACGRARPAGVGPEAWLLLHPPEQQDDRFPRGRRLLPAAPLATWQRVDAFGTEAECREERTRSATEVIERARRTQGDDARNDLAVRRAVNARCIPAEALRAPLAGP